jgi:hypothetical protein
MKNQYSPITLPINTALGWLFLPMCSNFLACIQAQLGADISQYLEIAP